MRNNWLNPPEWTRTEVLEFPGSVDGPWKRYVHDADKRGIGTVRYPRIVPKDADSAAKLKKRTLTNLYNEMPTWPKNPGAPGLDEAVFAGGPHGLVAAECGVTQVNTPNTPKSAGFVVRSDWMPACR